MNNGGTFFSDPRITEWAKAKVAIYNAHPNGRTYEGTGDFFTRRVYIVDDGIRYDLPTFDEWLKQQETPTDDQ